VSTLIVHAHVVEQTPHPIMGPAPFIVIQFDSIEYLKMDRRRIKRETARAVREWKKGRNPWMKKL
jgi:hypothetical protein